MRNCIDVIIPVYAPPKSFNRLIKILINDELVNKIILIVKGSLEIEENEKILVIKEPKKSCLSYVRKIGLNHCESVFIAFIDADILINKNHLTELLEKAIELADKYDNIAIEGTLTQIYQNKIISAYKTKKLNLKERGFTHNTLITRNSLINWNPPFTCAWEDYSITQHILKHYNSIWLRYQQKAISYHIKHYSSFKRTLWSNAGKRIIVKPSNISVIFNSINYLKRAIIQPFITLDVKYFKFNMLLAMGILAGHFNYNKYLYLNLD